ncbi:MULTISPECIES: undecaprenyl-diphosphate phosphatase [Prochlorococcus]|uniref:Undecaprenyl-diphosphatase n=1 Tax=Prochlorococcus marinus (strain SARG / CCMP1375 / SS120) TaxID=167539 RepID=UPPP_PROMA|nr:MULTISPECIES: undecaprenyl-diphosphate phosphatase [Prochlorococcus]Q7VCK5.1 RecName: Full=Undecaprenyl-diphosphatase; AltName: Full=Bacitracin resistance protein; AltName: Full=Undecaprenyl pyrophosphate phosphatase [Prochlorococcus marinus subsp. marinus str. CCMP1375]AAP99779.1 Bacitracin resistance protein [Prochlorococcus marinus subsp. marinus str. CCMP1375]KGG12744.1 Undecaprenyl-diphosphatasee [Prochlorococcus marinus str. LG]KGG22481.1 Undecaprenyl-diphosphatasee [Prochlorococcus ma
MVLLAVGELSASLSLLEECWHYLFLGIIQGLTEFFPISSTAHLKVIPLLLSWDDPGVAVTASLQLGSIIALIAYFWNDLAFLMRGISKASFQNSWNNQNTKLASAIVLGTLPIVFAGMLIKLFWQGYETSPIRSIPAIAVVSIVMALLLLIAENVGRRTRNFENLSFWDGQIIGFSQVLALIPGVSRSGITITTALMIGWERKSAARFSFLLGIPAITLAGLVELKQAFGSFELVDVFPLLLGITSSAISSWIAIDCLMKFLQTQSMMIFITYRFLFGTLLLFWYYLAF